MSQVTGVGVSDPSRPVGRDEVIDATVRSAADLFAERNPSQVSVREIAARAGVSHALVHRYLGTKDDIFHAALKHACEDAASFLAEDHGTSRIFSPDLPAGRYMHMIIRASLDGIDLSAEHLRMPHVDRMMETLKSQPLPAEDASRGFDERLLFAAVLAMAAGMDTVEPFFLSQAGLAGADKERLHSEGARLIGRILSMADPNATIE